MHKMHIIYTRVHFPIELMQQIAVRFRILGQMRILYQLISFTQRISVIYKKK